MNENGTKRKEWVKNAAIVFLIILLILTFFSNTIQNYSLPEVATQYVESGSITAKIRGMGVVESGDPYNVKIKEVREVASVEVKVGDKVEAGQVLCTLTEGDSKPLEDAKAALEEKQKALANAQNSFEMELLSGKYDVSIMQDAGNTDSVSSYLSQVIAAKNQNDAAEDKVKEWESLIAIYQRQIDFNPYSEDINAAFKAVKDAEAALDVASRDLTSAQNLLNSLDAQIRVEEAAISVSGGNASRLADLQRQRVSAQQNVANLESKKATAELNLANAKKATENIDNNLAKAMAFAKLSLENAKEYQTLTQSVYDELINNIKATYELSGLTDAIENAQKDVDKAQAEVDKLAANTMGNEVTAPISGLITSINVKSGVETPSDGIVFTMQPEGKGYTMSFSVTNQQATRVSVGDQAELVNAWRYDDVQVTLASIKPDPNNPGQSKQLTFDVTGEGVIAGQSLNVSVGQKSANYDMTVPNSAIREDNNGKFILVITSKSSPIGTRYFATRVDVEVLASDDTKSAISGAVESYSYVITTSTKPVEAGKQVRLANN